ncbi:MAG TPA: BamA/TamA family outer membrane protein [Firmicutes bacterium]|nr:BamA/TamA family outer membrane protein [Bacillota bacterium]
MRKVFLFVVVSLISLGLCSQMSMVGAAATLKPAIPELHREGDRLWAGQGYLMERDGIKILHVKGTPMEMGMQHALLLGEEANRLRPYIDPSMQEYKGWEALAWRFREFYMDVKLSPTFVRNLPQRYIEEMEGFVYAISGGLDTDIEPVLIGNVFQELSLMMCTSLAAFGSATVDGGLYHARNLDNSMALELVQSAFVAIVEPEGRLPYITLSYPANFGIMHAVNSAGIAVSMNYSVSNDATIDGMPFVFMLREIAETAQTLDEALQIIKETPRTVGLNIMVSDAKIPQAVVVEVSANRYAIRPATDGFISATNRYAVDSMKPYQLAGWHSSALRDERLAQLAQERYGEFSPAVMAEILRDKFAPGTLPYEKLLFGIETVGTMASVIFDATRQIMWVGVQDAAAPASDRDMLAFSLPQALAGADPRQPALDIPLQNPDDEHRLDWLKLHQVERLMLARDYQEAQAQLHPLLEKYPTSEYMLLLMGWTYMRLGDIDTAAEYFKRITQLEELANPRYLQEATYQLGVFADGKGDREEAIKWYKASLAVEVPDLSGAESIRQQAKKGLLTPQSPARSLLTSWSRVIVFLDEQQTQKTAGGEVVAISILGAHRTHPTWIPNWLGIDVGDKVTDDDVRTMRRSLEQLGTYEDVQVATVPLGEGRVHLVIRIQEGFGLYKEPVGFIIDTAIGLSQQTLSLRYDNLAGRAINIGGTYSWGPSRHRLAYVEVPLALAGANSVRLQAQTRLASYRAEYGEYAGTKQTDRQQECQVTLNRVLGPDWTLTLQGRLSDRQSVTLQAPAGYTPATGRFISTAASLTRSVGNKARASVFGITSSLLMAPAEQETFPSLSVRVDIKNAVGVNTQLALFGNAGWMDADTPLTDQFWLGDSRTLRGYSTIIPSTAYAHATLELRRFLESVMHVAVFADAGIFAEGNEVRSLWSPGASMRYQTPVGPEVRFTAAYAPEQHNWRYEFDFTSAW